MERILPPFTYMIVIVVLTFMLTTAASSAAFSSARAAIYCSSGEPNAGARWPPLCRSAAVAGGEPPFSSLFPCGNDAPLARPGDNFHATATCVNLTTNDFPPHRGRSFANNLTSDVDSVRLFMGGGGREIMAAHLYARTRRRRLDFGYGLLHSAPLRASL